MNTVLIVEDEKMISRGFKAIIKRSEVEVSEILECKNGEEALDVLKNKKIDVMFTDIRMPRMDGIELVKRMNELDYQPKTVVVSGYDDFSYAVEMLRYGVRDYILKPIEREKINELLKKFEKEIEEEKQLDQEKFSSWKQQLKYFLLHKNVKEKEKENIAHQFHSILKHKYVAVVFHMPVPPSNDNSSILLSDIDGQNVLLIDATMKESVIMNDLSEYCVGISMEHEGIDECRQAYEEAITARKKAFTRCVPVNVFEKEECEYEKIKDGFSEGFVQQFGTESMEDGIHELKKIFFAAKRGMISQDSFFDLLKEIHIVFDYTYEKIIDHDMENFSRFVNPLDFKQADIYLEKYLLWIREMKQLLLIEFDNFKNKEKISRAVQYMNENYTKDLNMAMVSNYVSMNYSLFSISFKEYMQMNFVNYLKKIRINEAKRLLQSTDMKIIDISKSVGYDNEKHFMKTFKSTCGVSPSEYRKNMEIGSVGKYNDTIDT